MEKYEYGEEKVVFWLGKVCPDCLECKDAEVKTWAKYVEKTRR